ncbi:hypothetical protein PoB_004688200 [Plakobranchus ocellatus]|uniref:Uncharacterized protein n=1 Tax=Plakobranchus ocellatus TaxID=259542 RepID=A0AAV4BM01_9GAST|nr:hypothetical protein PoB_004688200 [Plakobranchus ocellatus]
MRLKGRGGSSGRAVGYHPRGPGLDQIFIAPLYPPSTEWVAKSLKTRRKHRTVLALKWSWFRELEPEDDKNPEITK